MQVLDVGLVVEGDLLVKPTGGVDRDRVLAHGDG